MKKESVWSNQNNQNLYNLFGHMQLLGAAHKYLSRSAFYNKLKRHQRGALSLLISKHKMRIRVNSLKKFNILFRKLKKISH